MGLAVDESIEDVVARLQRLGVGFRGPVDEGQLKLAYFTDPDGNELNVAEARRG